MKSVERKMSFSNAMVYTQHYGINRRKLAIGHWAMAESTHKKLLTSERMLIIIIVSSC